MSCISRYSLDCVIKILIDKRALVYGVYRLFQQYFSYIVAISSMNAMDGLRTQNLTGDRY